MAFEAEKELLLVFDCCCQLFDVELDAESFA